MKQISNDNYKDYLFKKKLNCGGLTPSYGMRGQKTIFLNSGRKMKKIFVPYIALVIFMGLFLEQSSKKFCIYPLALPFPSYRADAGLSHLNLRQVSIAILYSDQFFNLYFFIF